MHDKQQLKVLTAAQGFNTLVYDFEKVQAGDALNYEFLHDNRENLTIESVSASCGCATPHTVKKDKIAGVFKIPENHTGAYKKTLTVYFKDGQQTHIVDKGIHMENPEKLQLTLHLNANLS